MKKLLQATLLALSTFLASEAYATNPFIGKRGPGLLQPDFRRTAIVNEKGKQVVYDGIVKCWTGNGNKKGLGVFGFLRGQYKQVNSKDGENSGWGAFLAGLGPRATLRNLHVLTYFAVKSSLADGNSRIPLDSGSLDEKLGLLATQMIGNYELDFLGEYAWTGENAAGKNLPNEFNFGLVGGRGLGKDFRVVAGLTGLVKGNGDYLVNLRGVLRYTFCPAVHGEVLIDEGAYGKNIPKGISFTALVRYNPF